MFLNVDASDAPIRVKTVFEKKKILKKEEKNRGKQLKWRWADT
jgi:hypothetical protein